MATAIPISVAVPQPTGSIESKNASDRYEKTYLRARKIAQAGDNIQIAGWVLGGLLFCGAIFAAHTVLVVETRAADWLPPGGLTIGAILSVFLLWLVGLLVGARGEHLKASLDSAVNSSPFLSNAQRAKVMLLR